MCSSLSGKVQQKFRKHRGSCELAKSKRSEKKSVKHSSLMTTSHELILPMHFRRTVLITIETKMEKIQKKLREGNGETDN